MRVVSHPHPMVRFVAYQPQSPRSHVSLVRRRNFVSLLLFFQRVAGVTGTIMCRCENCQATRRNPSMQVQGVELMCSPIVDTSDDCVSGNATVAMARFCFAGCVVTSLDIHSVCKEATSLANSPLSIASDPTAQAFTGSAVASELGNAGDNITNIEQAVAVDGLDPALAGDIIEAMSDAAHSQASSGGAAGASTVLQPGDEVYNPIPTAAERAAAVIAARLPALELEEPDEDAPGEAPEAADEQSIAEADAAASAANAAAENAAAAAENAVLVRRQNVQKAARMAAMVAQAQGRLATASGFEARAAQAETRSARAAAGVGFALRGAQQSILFIRKADEEVKASAVRAAIYARSARLAAQQAKAEMREIEAIPKEAAALAASQAEAEMWAEARASDAATAAEKAALTFVEPPGAVGVAAARAAAPYNRAMDQALAWRTFYDSKAREHSAVAQTLIKSAQTQAENAYELQMTAGHTRLARKTLSASIGTLNQAVEADAKASQLRQAAEAAVEGLPLYTAAAAAIANRATVVDSARWMPPAVPLGGMPPTLSFSPGPSPSPSPR
eukprot:TRINITY_DN51345_c0_g1_i1.p1 TRINITY_DN51345_c0_g1~~TRINITY_DN51345_c0_g1_i1.p1  ORF type:complete len:561 (-),score=103.91 TRINITY_DN51345_c0_g1_i1:215-1897(-)